MEFIENVIVNSTNVEVGDAALLFGSQPIHYTDADCIEALMVELGIYPSLSAARRVGRYGPIPDGFTEEYKASKVRRLWIWNPVSLPSASDNQELGGICLLRDMEKVGEFV